MAFRARAFVSAPAGDRPGFDHADVFEYSPGRARLYVAHTGADRIDVIDCASDKYLRALPGHPGVAGVLIDSEAGLMIASDRGCARVSVYRCGDESLVGQCPVGPRPNGLAYDPARRNIFAFNLGEPVGENCTASVVSVDEMRVTATIPLPGRPRWAVYDASSDRVFANIRAPAQIAAIDADQLCQVCHFDVPAAGPHGLALSADRLYCAADAGELVALGLPEGRVVSSVELPGEPDVVARDARAGRLFVAIGDPGVVVVIEESTLRITERIETERGAHTIAWDPTMRTLWAFLPLRCGALALAES